MCHGQKYLEATDLRKMVIKIAFLLNSLSWSLLKNCCLYYMCLVVSVVSDSATPWTVARQTPLSMGILQARILEWLTMPSSRASSQPRFPALQAHSLPSEPPRKPQACGFYFANMNCNFFKEVNVHYNFHSIFLYHKHIFLL